MLLTETLSKPKLTKHVKTLKHIYKNTKIKKSEEPKLEHLPQH